MLQLAVVTDRRHHLARQLVDGDVVAVADIDMAVAGIVFQQEDQG